ncbi:MAG: NCS2 family permease, partial [Succinivibrio sp.]|nr:NCS2 family permease [Succinivibrio sp.]
QHIIDAVPLSLKSAIVAGIGFFIAFVGLQQANIVVQSQATAVTLGHLTDVKVLLAIIGIFIIGALMALRFAGAILVGILIITIAGMCLGVAPVPKAVSDVVSFTLPSIKDTFLQMDIIGALDYGLFSVIFTFTIVELFDNLGTLIGVSKAAGLMDEKGKIEGIDRALMTDSAGTMLSAAFGTCTVTSYVESMVGTQVGGRTGLTTVVVGLCFLLAFIFSPLAALIPGYATAPALIVIGAMMLKTIKNIDFSDHTEVIPVFLTIIMMPLTYSIANGFGFGFVSYCILKVLSKRAKEVKPIMWVISLCFVISFILHS